MNSCKLRAARRTRIQPKLKTDLHFLVASPKLREIKMECFVFACSV
jgi:hypothetical protein